MVGLHRVILSYLSSSPTSIPKDAGFSNWTYHFPVDDLNKATYDFYALSLIDSDSIKIRDEGLAYALKEAKEISITSMKSVMLEALYRACSCEIFHFQSFYNNEKEKSFLSAKMAHKGTYEALKKVINPDGHPYERAALSDYEHRFAIVERLDIPLGTFFRFCEDAFAQSAGYWHSSYGGKAWVGIAHGGYMLEKAKDLKDTMTYVDHAIDLEHNTGSIFTKWPEKKISPSVLTWKKDVVDPLEYYSHLSPGLKDAWLAAYKATEGRSLDQNKKRIVQKNKEVPKIEEEEEDVHQVTTYPIFLMLDQQENGEGQLKLFTEKKFVNKFVAALKRDYTLLGSLKDGDTQIKVLRIPEIGAAFEEALIKLIDVLKYLKDGETQFKVLSIPNIRARFVESLKKYSELIHFLKDGETQLKVLSIPEIRAVFVDALKEDSELIYFLKDGEAQLKVLSIPEVEAAFIESMKIDSVTNFKGDTQLKVLGITNIKLAYAGMLEKMPSLIENFVDDFIRFKVLSIPEIGQAFAWGMAEYPSAIRSFDGGDTQLEVLSIPKIGGAFFEALLENPEVMEYLIDGATQFKFLSIPGIGPKYIKAQQKNPDVIAYLKDEDAQIAYLSVPEIGKAFAEAVKKSPDLTGGLHGPHAELKVEELLSEDKKSAPEENVPEKEGAVLAKRVVLSYIRGLS